MKITATIAAGMLNQLGGLADGGKLRIYDGTQPASGGGAITTQVKLLEFTLDADAFPTTVTNSLTASPIGPSAGLATGTATWFRMVKADGTTVLVDGTAGEGAEECVLTEADITTLVVAAVTSLVITQPIA